MLDLAKLGVDALTVDADAFILREPWQVNPTPNSNPDPNPNPNAFILREPWQVRIRVALDVP